VAGMTRSDDFPTKNPIQSRKNGDASYADAFIFKLSSDGSSLL